MAKNQKVLRMTLTSSVLFAALCLGCSERKTETTVVPPATSAPASAPPPSTSSSSSAPVIAPGTAEDVTKKGTSTGMIGGESGTVASSGKPGTGTDSGAGTGAAQGSDSKTTDKK